MEIITLDFETYFDDDYSLSKMTTEEYVRDPRFQTHCLGLKNGTSGAIALSGRVLDRDKLRPLNNHAVLCHHGQFDGAILSHHYAIRPAFWFDTLSMARVALPHLRSHSLGSLAAHFGFQEKTVPYQEFKGKRILSYDLQTRLEQGCKDDLELTHALFLELLPMVPKEELQVIDLTIRMFTEPALRLDRPLLRVYLDKTQRDKEALLDRIGATKTELGSAEKFAELLRGYGIEPPTKLSPRTGREAYAFAKSDDGLKALAEHENPDVQALVAARLGTKSTITETRCQRLLDMATRGPMPVYLKYAGAHTFRWSGGDKMNWQNFPRRGDIRNSILAPEGYVIVVGDLAQIECRILNWLAGEEWVLQAFREGRDIYSEDASSFYGRKITKQDVLERHLGKTIELGCGFGMGGAKFQVTCRGGALGGPPVILSEAEAMQAVQLYRQTHRNVVNYWKEADRILQYLFGGGNFPLWGPFHIENRKIILPNDLSLDYSNLGYDGKDFFTLTRRGKAKIYGAKLVENIVQALARVVLSQAMLRISKKYKIVTCTHDEVVCLAPQVEGAEALKFVLAELIRMPVWADEKLPLAAEGGQGMRYGK